MTGVSGYGGRYRNRLLLSMPLYGAIPATWFVRFIEVDKTPVVDMLATRKLYLAKSMTTMVNAALKAHHEPGRAWDRLVVWEADMLPPRGALARIAQYNDDLDIVGSAYFQHTAPHHPLFYSQQNEDHFTALAPNQVDEMMANPGLYPVDAVGLGFTSIHRRVFQKWDQDVNMFGGEHVLGHDMWFCREAKRQGFTVHVDTGIHCAHLSEVPVMWEPKAAAIRVSPPPRTDLKSILRKFVTVVRSLKWQ